MQEQWKPNSQGTLCRLCRDLIEEVHKATGEHKPHVRRNPYHDERSSEESLRSGCSICNALAREWTKLDKVEVEASKIKGSRGVWMLCRKYRQNEPGYSVMSFTLGELDDRSLFDAVRLHGNPTSETITDHDLDLVNKWMRLCIDHHEQCSSNMQPGRYPPRLLSVQHSRVRLLERRHEVLRGPYATLSYSWGKNRFEVLTKQTLPKFQQEIDPTVLLPTFSDAIRVCRKLGIPYLWIDCLCILQPEHPGTRDADQADEIAEMSEIYSNAVLNLGFAAARSPFDGFSVKRALTPQCWIELPLIRLDDGIRSYVLMLETAGLFNVTSNFSSPHINAIFDRAWCLQERFLS